MTLTLTMATFGVLSTVAAMYGVWRSSAAPNPNRKDVTR